MNASDSSTPSLVLLSPREAVLMALRAMPEAAVPSALRSARVLEIAAAGDGPNFRIHVNPQRISSYNYDRRPGWAPAFDSFFMPWLEALRSAIAPIHLGSIRVNFSSALSAEDPSNSSPDAAAAFRQAAAAAVLQKAGLARTQSLPCRIVSDVVLGRAAGKGSLHATMIVGFSRRSVRSAACPAFTRIAEAHPDWFQDVRSVSLHLRAQFDSAHALAALARLCSEAA